MKSSSLLLCSQLTEMMPWRPAVPVVWTRFINVEGFCVDWFWWAWYLSPIIVVHIGGFMIPTLPIRHGTARYCQWCEAQALSNNEDLSPSYDRLNV
jgi:hypothetical protein